MTKLTKPHRRGHGVSLHKPTAAHLHQKNDKDAGGKSSVRFHGFDLSQFSDWTRVIFPVVGS